MVGRLVQESGKCVHIQLDFVALDQVRDHSLANHGVFVVIDVVLIVETSNFGSIPFDGDQNLFHIVGTHVN
jgi:hypothetical protein